MCQNCYVFDTLFFIVIFIFKVLVARNFVYSIFKTKLNLAFSMDKFRNIYYNSHMEKNYFELIEKDKLPKHVAIIMDGNGRWAKSRKQIRTFGHFEGANRVVEIVRTSSNLGINVLSLFAFSTENWKRPVEEVDKIMFLVVNFIDKYIEELAENNVVLKVLGHKEELPNKVREKVDYAINLTKNNSGMILNICLNYGSQLEILDACKKMILENRASSDEEIQKLTIEDFSKRLYTETCPPVDLMIRPSGELRLSNFLLFQSAYAELYFSNILWPDFNSNELYKAIVEYQNRNRRFGGI